MSDEPFDWDPFTEHDKRFFGSLKGEDDVGMILRVHLHCEGILFDLIDKHVPNTADLQPVRLRFITCVAILSAFNFIDPNARDRMRWLNVVRNRLAHTDNESLTEADFDAMMKVSGISGRAAVDEINSHEKDRSPGSLIRNGLFIWRNNLMYLKDYGVEAYAELERLNEDAEARRRLWTATDYDDELEV